ncbi:MAG: ferredoxin oxidoreductase [Acidobacteria bacterium RIFCSPLOWO2_12_FULL_65_11]|nr:MAG: ferredoxin oxidoreductase [Acidobacteria bacterium RIFCSPLOWO2_02_FULL_64_15]OFW29086.1 MAG: ferredoxin oxidoreductase [Acidobacteria bacterium RIFCSPLOWO2_12_FULL_65_11]
MPLTDSALQEEHAAPRKQRVVNDFSLQVATVNGSGSQTANLVLLRSILLMGVPVSGKNMFPSNIAGLPTWYTIRASKRGYTGRKKEVDFLVAMNPETAKEDVLTLEPGAAVVYDEPLKLNALRSDLVFYPVPFDKLVAPVCSDAKLRRLVRNMIYDGILAKLLGIDLTFMDKALGRQMGKKAKAVALNQAALKAGWDFAEANLTKQDPFALEPMNLTAGKILIEGNQAAAIGCLMAGVTVVAWYPITPSSSLVESLIGYMKKHRVDKETGKATFAVVQAEDEIASLGMVIGASWAGARSMTSTSGPGISLMSEFTGLAYYAETPAVIFDVQRVGPSTGLPTRTAQGDLLFVAVLSHGDTKHIMLLPSSVEECYAMAMEAFELAEHFQTPVFVMLDLDLGMNNWMSDGFEYPTKPIDRGKLLTPDVLKRLGEWGRYRDVDGDGIAYRTVPGDGMPAYFTRGSGHNAKGQYSERPDDYVENMNRLARKFETARRFVPKPVIETVAGAKVGLVGYGTSHWAMIESRDQLREESDVKTSYFRLRAYPFDDHELAAFIDAHERIYVIEQNRDAQLLQLMKLDLSPERVAKLRSVRHYNGLPIDARSVTDDVLSQEGYEVAERNGRVARAGMTGGE